MTDSSARTETNSGTFFHIISQVQGNGQRWNGSEELSRHPALHRLPKVLYCIGTEKSGQAYLISRPVQAGLMYLDGDAFLAEHGRQMSDHNSMNMEFKIEDQRMRGNESRGFYAKSNISSVIF